MTSSHTALYVRFSGAHYHQDCLPSTILEDQGLVHLDMNTRANIAQCLHVLCYSCGKPLVLFPDRKQITLRQWPDMTIPDVDQAVAFAQAAIGQLALEDGKPYTVLHAWTVPPLEDQPGAVVAICQEEEVEQEQEPQSGPLARERFTPPLWTSQHIGTAKCWELISHDDETIGIVISSEADARLIVEAPNMFALLKEYIEQHAADCSSDKFGCVTCIATRRLMQRVLGEA